MELKRNSKKNKECGNRVLLGGYWNWVVWIGQGSQVGSHHENQLDSINLCDTRIESVETIHGNQLHLSWLL
jgi:hypothetical protein